MKVLVIQPWGIGDVLLTVQMLVEIAERFPSAQIHLAAAGYETVELIRQAPLLKKIHFVNINSRTLLGRLRVVYFYWKLSSEKFDVAFIGTNVSSYHAILARYFSNIPNIVGDFPKLRWAYTHHRAQIRNEHRTVTHLALLDVYLQDAGKIRTPVRSTVWLGANARTEAKHIFSKLGLENRETLGIYCRQSPEGKGLPKTLAIDTVKKLANVRASFAAVYILSPGEVFDEQEWPPGKVVAVSIPSLEVLAAFLGMIGSFVSGDMGLSHIADSVGTPTCVISGPTSIEETGAAGAYFVKSDEKPPCMPCYRTKLFGNCPYNFNCIRGIHPDKIVAWYLNLPLNVVVRRTHDYERAVSFNSKYLSKTNTSCK
jgi:ADP-heptose:LPS heptosyltransferase